MATQSMSRAGNPKDNAVMESYWERFKDVLRVHFRYWEQEDLLTVIQQTVYYFHNICPVPKLNGKPPVRIETGLAA